MRNNFLHSIEMVIFPIMQYFVCISFVQYIILWLLFGIALHIVFALFQSFQDEKETSIPIVITLTKETNTLYQI